MKKLISSVIFILCLSLAHAQSANADSVKKEHSSLMTKANSFFSSYKSGIDARIKKTERSAGSIPNDIAGAKSLINIYRQDSVYYQHIIQKGDSLSKMLQAHDNVLKASKLTDDFLSASEKNMEQVKQVINYANDTQKQAVKRLKNIYKELKRMEDEKAKTDKKNNK